MDMTRFVVVVTEFLSAGVAGFTSRTRRLRRQANVQDRAWSEAASSRRPGLAKLANAEG